MGARILTGYIHAFLGQVNYYEIAENMASDNPEFIEEAKTDETA
jgi:hypothetical protein